MKKIGFVLASLAAATLLQAQHSVHWGYTGHEGPDFWGELSPKFSACKNGLNQSPINIDNSIVVESNAHEPIGFHYGADALDVVNNGHSIQVNVDGYSSITIDGKEFALKQFHFHSPSENEIDGRSFPLEAHFVHASKDGELAVVGVLFELGDTNEALDIIWKNMPQDADAKNTLKLSSKQIEKLLPIKRDYYRFNGSLTTPPCSEGVRWMVLKDYVSISKEQVKRFLEVMKHPNNRPVQPINARKVIK